jgi:hypothetical protein
MHSTNASPASLAIIEEKQRCEASRQKTKSFLGRICGDLGAPEVSARGDVDVAVVLRFGIDPRLAFVSVVAAVGLWATLLPCPHLHSLSFIRIR